MIPFPYISVFNRRGGVKRPWLDDGISFNNGKIILQFDDGWESNYLNGLPLFQEKGVRATIFALGYFAGTESLGFNLMTWEQIRSMKSASMEIQCHGYKGSILTDLTDGQLPGEFTDNNTAFINNSIPSPNHMAYSGGAYDDRTLTFVDNFRLTGRTILGGYTNRKSSKYKLLGYQLQQEVNVIKSQIDYAKANNLALILWGHMIGVAHGLSISVAALEEIIDYGKSEGLDFITISELYEQMLYIDLRCSRYCPDDQVDLIFKNRLINGIISIERSDNGVDFSEIHITEPGEDTYSDAGLTLNHAYTYKVRGMHGTNYYPYSQSVTVVTSGNELFYTVEWTLPAGWSESGTKLIGTGAMTLPQKIILEVGKQYHVTFNILSMSGDTVTCYIGGNHVGQITTTGVKTFDSIITTQTTFKIAPWVGSGLNIEMDNFSVTEIL